jgi:hypothetical protein
VKNTSPFINVDSGHLEKIYMLNGLDMVQVLLDIQISMTYFRKRMATYLDDPFILIVIYTIDRIYNGNDLKKNLVNLSFSFVLYLKRGTIQESKL